MVPHAWWALRSFWWFSENFFRGRPVAPMRARALHAALLAEVELFRELRAGVLERYGLTIDLAHEEVLESEI
jgi:hypothetical protein